jgi:hypothetical protein
MVCIKRLAFRGDVSELERLKIKFLNQHPIKDPLGIPWKPKER